MQLVKENQMPSLNLYYFDSCPYCQKVLRKIEQLGLKNIEFSDTRANSQHRDKLIKDTGRQTVPCLYIDGKPMHESDDIISWLEANKEKLS